MAVFIVRGSPLETVTLYICLKKWALFCGRLFVFKPLLNRILHHSQNNCYDGTINFLWMLRIKLIERVFCHESWTFPMRHKKKKSKNRKKTSSEWITHQMKWMEFRRLFEWFIYSYFSLITVIFNIDGMDCEWAGAGFNSVQVGSS